MLRRKKGLYIKVIRGIIKKSRDPGKVSNDRHYVAGGFYFRVFDQVGEDPFQNRAEQIKLGFLQLLIAWLLFCAAVSQFPNKQLPESRGLEEPVHVRIV